MGVKIKTYQSVYLLKLSLVVFFFVPLNSNGSDSNWLYCQKSNSFDGYIFTGAYNVNGDPASTIAYTKIDFNGNINWQKSVSGNTDFIIPYALNKGQINYYICGSSNSNGFGSPGDAYILSFDENGNKIWDLLLGEINTDILYGVCEKTNGEIVAIGYSNSFSTLNDILLVRMDASGNLLNSKIIYNDNNDAERGIKIKATADGGYILLGSIFTGSFNDLFLIKYDFNNNISWSKQYSLGTFYDPIDIVENILGDFIIVGANTINGTSANNLLTVSDTGDILWFKTYFSNELEKPSNLIEQNGNIYVSGMIQSIGNTNGILDALYFATNNNGNLIFSNKINVNGMRGKRIGCLETDAINQNEISMVVGEFVSTPRLFDIGVQKVSIHSNTCNNTEYPLTEGTLNVTETTLNLNQQNISLFEFNGFTTQNINEFTNSYCEQTVYPYFEVDVDPCTGEITTTNLTTNGVSYNWNFGDGNSSTASNSTHTFTNPGTYTITLFADDGNGNTDWYDVEIVIPAPPIVSFSLPTITPSNSPITLTASPTGGIFSGNGIIFSAFNPSIAGPGQHTITYTYTDVNGCSTSVSNTILAFVVTYNFVNYNLGTVAP